LKTCYDIVHTPWGELSIVCNAQALLWAGFDFQPPEGCEPVLSPLLQAAKLQLEEYLAGRRRFFSLPLAPNGTPFQHAVWNALLRIPYGETRTYKDIAQQIGRPNACRAVGMANNKNPLLLFIPCHRVVGTGGALTGYAGGLQMKRDLLLLEASAKAGEQGPVF